MATFVPVPNTAEFKLFYRYQAQQLMNTFYFTQDTPWTEAELATAANAAFDRWDTIVMPDLNEQLHLVECQVISLETATAPASTYIDTSDGHNASGIPLPGNCAFCIKFLTANRGRSFRGRIYLPGLVQAGSDTPGQLTTGVADALKEAVEAAMAGIALDTGAVHTVVSRYSGVDANGKPIPRATGVATPVTAVAYTDVYIDSQRKRLQGRGI